MARSPLSLWVFGSVVTYALATCFWWLVRGRERWPALRAVGLEDILRCAFALGVPYLALGGWPMPPLRALISLNQLGLVGLLPKRPAAWWFDAWSLGLGLVVSAVVVLVLARVYARRPAGGTGLEFPQRAWWALLLDGLCLQMHWAFYRTAMVVISEDEYVGVFLGLGLVYLEWALNPYWREGWRVQGSSAARWLRAALAMVSALVFLLTRNLWVCLGTHWLVELALWRIWRGRVVVSAEGQSKA
jgi:hypothetical protein